MTSVYLWEVAADSKHGDPNSSEGKSGLGGDTMNMKSNRDERDGGDESKRDHGGHGKSTAVGEEVAFYGVFCLRKVAGPLSWESVHQVKVSE